MKRYLVLGSALSLLVSASVLPCFAVAKGGMNLANFVAEYDLNGDGAVSLDELTLVRTELFTAADTDGNGLLSTDELAVSEALRRQTAKTTQFNTLDTDADGTLSLEEFAAISTAQADMLLTHNAAHLARLDTDGDSQISLAEFTENTSKFDRLDTDANGVISTDELAVNPPVLPRGRHGSH